MRGQAHLPGIRRRGARAPRHVVAAVPSPRGGVAPCVQAAPARQGVAPDRAPVIDLHVHTTASDGRSTPEELVRQLAKARITVTAVTDHDTTAAVAEVRAHAEARRIRVITGIEITAVRDSEDVHMLGYGFDPGHPALVTFLATQRADRRRRLEEMHAKLVALGLPVEIEPQMAATAEKSGRALGRPLLAAALLKAGYVDSIAEAFDRYLGNGGPAFVPRRGASPADVVALVHDAGGVASIAHPGKLKSDALIEPLAAAGLDAIEAYHPDHDAVATAAYRSRAAKLGLLVTGGSDFHGRESGRVDAMGTVTLPADDFAQLAERIR
ncbi:MAG: PHP domain-containing protein [Acidobacteria bacterium]|nr:MAG: PHP domain-containing protein [Acidobacteriota bacterium]